MDTIDRGTQGQPVHTKYITLLRLWRIRQKTRHSLMGLDSARLRDIGLTPEEARREAGKWVWQS